MKLLSLDIYKKIYKGFTSDDSYGDGNGYSFTYRYPNGSGYGCCGAGCGSSNGEGDGDRNGNGSGDEDGDEDGDEEGNPVLLPFSQVAFDAERTKKFLKNNGLRGFKKD